MGKVLPIHQLFDIVQIGLVHGDQVVKFFQIAPAQLPACMVDKDSAVLGSLNTPVVRRLADVVVGGSAAVTFNELVQLFFFYLMVENGFGQRGSANVPQTNKQDFNHG